MPENPQDPLLIETQEHVECLLGNEAIVRGALEAGVGFASGYPGTPSSEVTDSFARIHKPAGIVFEYSVNEKVALEMAFAASLAGTRSICAMKHLGLMYAGDPLSTIPYVGTVGGMLIVSAGDPACRTSPNEQDQRLLAPMLHIPVLDPSTPEEAHAMTRFAFELSEKSRLPVMLRPTTRVCHSRAVIRYGRLTRPEVKGFVRDPKRFVPIPVNARRLRIDLKDRIEIARQMIAESDFFRQTGEGKLAVLASGAPAATCADLLAETGIDKQLKLLTLGGVYPLPEQKILDALRDVDRVLVVEELSPYLEDAVRSLCARQGLKTEVLGKHTGHLPVEFEYQPDQIQQAMHAGLNLGSAPRTALESEPLPPRPPTLCPGCPHRATQFAARTVFGDEHLFFNDIGCYTLGYGPPLNTADALLCMGAGFSLAAGVSRVTGQRTVGILGDSTFFHSGMPPLLNAVKEDVNMVAVILDNQVTAMTGFQESPTVEMNGTQIVRDVSIEALVKALGVKKVEVVDPYNLPATIAAFERARDAQGLSVVISERACPVHHSRETHQPYKIATYAVDNDRCRTCGRECLDLRCNQEISEGFERHMARSRSMEGGRKIAPRPARAPCSVVCPLGLCIQGYTGNIAAGQYELALDHIVSQVVLPESVCRVCHHPCEAACVRTEIDEPVAVNHLKRFVVEWAHKEGRPYDPQKDPASGHRVAVVGAGPAGLAAAHDLCLRGHQVTLYDSDEKPGGLLRTGIPDFRLPPEALERDIQRVLSLGVTFEGNTAVGDDLPVSRLLTQGFDAVFLAVGASREIGLNIEDHSGDSSPRQTGALAYLKGPEPTGKQVVVIGGGNAAIDAARTAIRRGAEQVVIAYRREKKDMPAWSEEIEAALAEGVVLETQLQPKRIDSGALLCARTRPGERDPSGRRRPVEQAGSDLTLPCDQVIVAIGQLAESPIEVECESDGSLTVDPDTGLTSKPKIYAGGDLTSSPRTVTDAIAAGRRAAWAIDCKLRGQEHANRRPPPPHPEKDPLGRPGTDTADRTPRQRPRALMAEDRKGHFKEVVSKFTEAQARLEASRCMVCGQCGNCRTCLDLFGCPAFYVSEDQIHIDPQLCMGCGVCAEICTGGAIREVTSAPSADDQDSAFGPVEPTEEIGE